MSPGPKKDNLLAIPTGLTIPRADVDALIDAGEAAVTGSTELQAFLADYPASPAASSKGR
jgi:hypothetical protein